jgi:methylphosphotriester-DNA--protein-cysteine methyltransferase
MHSHEQEDVVFVASQTRARFHKPNCKWVRRIPKRKRIQYSSHEEAEAASKKPCGTCRA